MTSTTTTIDKTADAAAAVVADVKCFFHEDTNTCTYVARDPTSSHAMIVDPVLDYDPSSARTGTAHNDRVVEYCLKHGLEVDYVVETHVHADHLTGADDMTSSDKFPRARTAIGENVVAVQRLFRPIFFSDDGGENEDPLRPDGSQFDILLKDNQVLKLGNLNVKVLHTPGHTPACVSLVVYSPSHNDDDVDGEKDTEYGDAVVFTGDTLFMPDFGTARCDFPGGSVEDMYRSVKRLYGTLPDRTKVYVGHDYRAPSSGRDHYAWETTIGASKLGNVQLSAATTLEEYASFRAERDSQLKTPRLIIPSLQVNLRNGRLPEPATKNPNGIAYLKIPLNVIGKE